MSGIDSERAFELLGIEPTSTREEVQRAYRALAFTAHPDTAQGTVGIDRMTELNLAYERALEAVEERENPTCICRGVHRSPLCKAHAAEKPAEVKCARCGDTQRVAVGVGLRSFTVDCPECCFE